MLLPKYWLRQQKLQRALADYPIYDPPHKVEERLLPKEKALENFQYFLDVRQERVRFFTDWLVSKFGIEASNELNGIWNTIDWAENYVGILMPPDTSRTSEVFIGYTSPWVGRYAGANALFDLGATLGEAIIHQRPNLTWRMEWSLSDYSGVDRISSKETLTILRSRERDVRQKSREPYSGYRRPVIASPDNASEYEAVYNYVLTYFFLTNQSVTIEYAVKHLETPKGLLSGNRRYLRDCMERILARQ